MMKLPVLACGAFALQASCSPDALTELTPPAPMPTQRGSGALTAACDFSQHSSQVVLAVADGPYGGKQDLVLVRADGTSFVAHSFGADRTEEARYIYISGIQTSVHGAHLVATRATDGTVVLDREGRIELEARDLATAEAFLAGQGVVIDHEESPVVVEAGAPPTVAIHRRGQTQRVPLPDYRDEPYVNVEAVRGQWALLTSYTADRSWRVNLETGAIDSIHKSIPEGLRQFGFQQAGDQRLYFTFDDGGGFLASLRDDFAGAIYRSADGNSDWARIGSSARDIDAIYGWAESGTYVISGISTLPKTTWPAPPADHEPMIAGDFVRIERPSLHKSYPVPTNGVELSEDGLCAAFVEQVTDGVSLRVLNVDSGVVATPEPPVQAGENVVWIPLGS